MVDQVVRVNKTFSFDLGRGDWPIEPILSGKTLVVIRSSGEFGFDASGVRATMNHLDAHIETCSRYLGINQSHHIAVEYQEFGDNRYQRSLADAKNSIRRLAIDLSAARKQQIQDDLAVPSI